jgi:hypothetical protein
MRWLEKLQREVHAAAVGAREGLADTAEKVALGMDQARLRLEARQVEARFGRALAALGRHVYDQRHRERLPRADAKIIALVASVEQIAAEQRALGRRLIELREGLARDQFLSMVDRLQRQNGTLLWCTVVRPAERLRTLGLPRGVRVICIDRHGRLIVPRGDTLIHPHDRILLVGRTGEIQEASEFLQT